MVDVRFYTVQKQISNMTKISFPCIYRGVKSREHRPHTDVNTRTISSTLEPWLFRIDPDECEYDLVANKLLFPRLVLIVEEVLL